MKLTKMVLLMFCNLSATAAIADGRFNDASNPCSKMSNNPICWEQPIPPRTTCRDVGYCTVITSVSMNATGKYVCQGGGEFDCTDLVSKYGTRISGASVLVTIQRIDMCHKPGACGARACMLSDGYASISHICR